MKKSEMVKESKTVKSLIESDDPVEAWAKNKLKEDENDGYGVDDHINAVLWALYQCGADARTANLARQRLLRVTELVRRDALAGARAKLMELV